MTTDTSERGLERLICTALTGYPCDHPESGEVREYPAAYDVGRGGRWPVTGEPNKAMRMANKGTSHESAVLFKISALLYGASRRVVVNAPDQLKYRGPHVWIRPVAGTSLDNGLPTRRER